MKKKQVVSGAVVLVLVAGIGWAMGFFNGQDPQLAELELIRNESFGNRENMSEEQRRGQHEQFREKVGQLSDDQRKQFFENSRPMFQQMMNEKMNKFFALPEEEQKAELDKWIDRMENRSNDRKAEGDRGKGGRGGPGGPGGRGGWEGMSQQERDSRRQQKLDSTTPELRAKFDKFKDMMNDRREERGLPKIDRPIGRRGRH